MSWWGTSWSKPAPKVSGSKAVPTSPTLVSVCLVDCRPGGRRQRVLHFYFWVVGCLSALVYQHSMTPLALPCKLMVPTKGQAQSRLLLNSLIKIPLSFRSFFYCLSLVDPNEEALELATPTDSVVELLKQGAGEGDRLCWFFSQACKPLKKNECQSLACCKS